MPAKDKVIKQLNKVFYLIDKPSGGGSTTLTAATAIGATALSVAANTNIAAGDRIRIGSGEQMESADVLSITSTDTITTVQGLVYAHASGAAVVEQIAYDLGHIEAAGVNTSIDGQSIDIPVSTQRLLFTTLTGYLNESISFALPCFTLPFFALATGQAQAQVTGSGTTASPTQLTTNGSEFSSVANACIVAVGTLFDGTYIRLEFWGVDMDYSGINFKLSRGALVSIPVKAIASAGGAAFSSNYAFTPSTTLTPTNAKVFDALSEVGVMVDTGTSTTTTALAAAGASVLALTSVSGVSQGTWLRTGTGSTAQFHWVESIASLNVTVRQPLYAAVASGATVTVVTPTAFDGTNTDGVAVSIGGSSDPLNIAERRLSIGTRPGGAVVGFSFGTIAASLANIAYGLGIAQSAISGGRLPLNSNIGGTGLDGLYLKGALKDGTIVWILAVGNNMDVSAFSLAINNAGPAASIPITGKPSSYLQFLQHP